MTNDETNTNEELFERFQTLIQQGEQVAEKIKKTETVIGLVTFCSADNICAAAILNHCLKKLNKGAHTIFVRSKEEAKKRVKELNYKLIFALGNCIPIKENFPNEIVIISHKLKDKCNEVSEDGNIVYYTTHHLDIPPNYLSTSGLAYFIARATDKKYHKLAPIALVGALAEEQYDHVKREVIGFNKIILDEGKREKFIEEEIGIKIKGRETLPIHKALAFSIEPVLPGLTGNENNCRALLSKLDIKMKDDEGNWRKIADLSKEEIKRLNDELIAIIASEKEQIAEDVNKLIGPIFFLPKEKYPGPTRNIGELAWLIKIACENELENYALSVLLGERNSHYNKLLNKVTENPGTISKFLMALTKEANNVIEEKEYIKLIKAPNTLPAEIAPSILRSIVKGEIIEDDKAIVLIVEKEKKVKLVVHDAKENIIRGHMCYPIIAKYKKIEKIKDITGDGIVFTVELKKKNLDNVIEELNKDLMYHYSGITEKEKENDIKTNEINENNKNNKEEKQKEVDKKQKEEGEEEKEASNKNKVNKNKKATTKQKKKNQRKIKPKTNGTLFEFLG